MPKLTEVLGLGSELQIDRNKWIQLWSGTHAIMKITLTKTTKTHPFQNQIVTN